MMKNQIEINNSIIKTISSTCTETSFCETKYILIARAEATNSNEDRLGDLEEYQYSKDVKPVDDTAQQTGFMPDIIVILCKVQWVVYNISCNTALGVTSFYWIYLINGKQAL